MKILLFGMGGQVGWELQRSLAPLGELVALNTRSQNLCGDFTNLAGIAQTIRAVAPDFIVNAAAYTAVDKAESEPELTHTINALAPGILAQEAERIGAWLIHYSSDYVFDGSGELAWKETDQANALSIYGKSKLEGEKAIHASECKHLIFRTSWVYAARGNNFAKTMLRLAQERDALNIVCDQIGAPTGADLLADVTTHAIRTVQQDPEDVRKLSGLYHLAANGQTSWHGYASFVIDFARKAGTDIKLSDQAIRPVPTSAFPLPAPRPKNSRLDTSKLSNTFELHLPDWQSGVRRMLSEILERKY